jgi:hypothetical protein
MTDGSDRAERELYPAVPPERQRDRCGAQTARERRFRCGLADASAADRPRTGHGPATGRPATNGQPGGQTSLCSTA